MFKISISETPLTLNPNDQIKVRDERWKNKLKSNYKTIEVEFENLYRIVQSDYRLYSAGEFKDNFAANKNWVGQDIFVLDVDDGLPIPQALERIKEYRAMIHTTSSHQKEKGGIKCDRYRIIIPLTTRTSCTEKEYQETMIQIVKNIFDFVDKKCVDASRIYFGAAESEIYYTKGLKYFDFEKQLSIMREIKKITQAAKAQKPTPIKREYKQGEDVIAKFNQENTVENMLSRYGYKQQGNRWLSPSSSTGIAGVIISQSDDGKTWAYNHHSSDDWENEDSFGIYAKLEYNGNMSEAVKSLTK